MKTLKERTEFAITQGFSVGRLAKAAGRSSSAVSQWRSGETRELKADSALGLSKLTGWATEWWISGKEPRIIQKAHSTDDLYSDTTPARAPVIEWARLGDDVLKDPSELGGAESPDYVPVGTPGKRVKLVPVIDDSLSPRLIVGDMVAIDPDNTTPKRGQVALFRSSVDGEFFLRRFQPLAYPDFEAVDAKGIAMDSKRYGLEVVGVNCGMRPSEL